MLFHEASECWHLVNLHSLLSVRLNLDFDSILLSLSLFFRPAHIFLKTKLFKFPLYSLLLRKRLRSRLGRWQLDKFVLKQPCGNLFVIFVLLCRIDDLNKIPDVISGGEKLTNCVLFY